MKKLVLLFVSIICIEQLFAQNYAVSLINDSLLKGANVVVRLEDERYELKSLDRAVYRYKRAITILNEEGESYADVGIMYDKFNSIDFIEGTLYDAMGKKIKTLKKSDVKDLSGTSEISLAEDNRYKSHSFYHRVYPYTVEYEYQVFRKETLFFPSWYPQASSFYAVEESKFSLVLPADYQLRHKTFNYTAAPEVTKQGDKVTYQWSVKNLPARA